MNVQYGSSRQSYNFTTADLNIETTEVPKTQRMYLKSIDILNLTTPFPLLLFASPNFVKMKL
jgi:hypothetical protein